MKQYNSEKRAVRDAKIVQYHRQHPGVSIRAIGRIFKLSHVMVINILRDADRTDEAFLDNLIHK